jgi:acetyl-CoA synthetase (ADP-forming)
LLRKLKLWPILDGVRGRPKLDVDAVVDTLVRLSWLAYVFGPRLQDIEINPLIVRVAGQGAVAVDGRGSLTA